MTGKFIGTLAREFRVSSRTLRFYEAMRLLPRPARTEGGYRVYGDETAQRLTFISRAKGLGLSLREIRQILLLRDSGRLPCDSVKRMFTERLRRIDQQMAVLQAVRAATRMMLAHCRHIRNEDERKSTRKGFCPAIEALATGRSAL